MNEESSEPFGKATLSDIQISHIYACLSVGASLKDAASYARASARAIRDRRRADPEFSRGLRQAGSRGKVTFLNRIARAPAWQAAAWVLERRWRRQFGRSVDADAGQASEVPLRSLSYFDEEDLRALLPLLVKGHLVRDQTEGNSESPDAGSDRPAADAGPGGGGTLPQAPA